MAVLLLGVGLALAHDVAGELPLRPFVRDGELVGAFTTNGLAVRGADGVFRRTCLEVLPTGTLVADAWLRADGTYVVGTLDGVRRTTADGCDTTPDPALTGTKRRFVPANGLLYLHQYRTEGDTVWVSDDDGATFTELPPLPGKWLVEGLAADGLGRLVVTGIVDRAFAVTAWDGIGWVSSAAPVHDGAHFIGAMGAAPDGVGSVVATVAAVESGMETRLWGSSGGDWVELVTVPGTPTGYGCVGAACLVGTPTALFGWDASIGASSLAPIAGGPSQCLYAIDGAVWACRERLADTLIEVTRDGRTFAPALLTGDTVDLDCIGDLCVQTAEPPVTTEPETDPGLELEESKGCATTPSGPSVGALVALVLARRRRIRGRDRSPPTCEPIG